MRLVIIFMLIWSAALAGNPHRHHYDLGFDYNDNEAFSTEKPPAIQKGSKTISDESQCQWNDMYTFFTIYFVIGAGTNVLLLIVIFNIGTHFGRKWTLEETRAVTPTTRRCYKCKKPSWEGSWVERMSRALNRTNIGRTIGVRNPCVACRVENGLQEYQNKKASFKKNQEKMTEMQRKIDAHQSQMDGQRALTVAREDQLRICIEYMGTVKTKLEQISVSYLNRQKEECGKALLELKKKMTTPIDTSITLGERFKRHVAKFKSPLMWVWIVQVFIAFLLVSSKQANNSTPSVNLIPLIVSAFASFGFASVCGVFCDVLNVLVNEFKWVRYIVQTSLFLGASCFLFIKNAGETSNFIQLLLFGMIFADLIAMRLDPVDKTKLGVGVCFLFSVIIIIFIQKVYGKLSLPDDVINYLIVGSSMTAILSNFFIEDLYN